MTEYRQNIDDSRKVGMGTLGALYKGLNLNGAGGGTRTPTGLPLLDFESLHRHHQRLKLSTKDAI